MSSMTLTWGCFFIFCACLNSKIEGGSHTAWAGKLSFMRKIWVILYFGNSYNPNLQEVTHQKARARSTNDSKYCSRWTREVDFPLGWRRWRRQSPCGVCHLHLQVYKVFFICSSANAYMDSITEGDTNTGVRREGQALTFMQRICEKKSVSFNIRQFLGANKTFYSVCRVQKLATPKMLSWG